MVGLHSHNFDDDGKCFLCGIDEKEWRAKWGIKTEKEYYTEGTGKTLRELQAIAEEQNEQILREDGFYEPYHPIIEQKEQTELPNNTQPLILPIERIYKPMGKKQVHEFNQLQGKANYLLKKITEAENKPHRKRKGTY